MRMIGSTIVVVGDGKVVTWNLPAGDHVPKTRGNMNNSIQTTKLKQSRSISSQYASISPDLNYIAFGGARSSVLGLQT